MEGKKMLGLFLPAYQHTAKPIEPSLSAGNRPAPCAPASFVRDVSGFLAATAHVRGEARFAHGRAHVFIISAFIQAHALRSLLRRRRSLHDAACDHCTHQFHVVAIGARNRCHNGHAMPLVQQRSLDARVPAVGRIGTGFFPPQRHPGHRPVCAQQVPVNAFRFINEYTSFSDRLYRNMLSVSQHSLRERSMA